MNKRLILAITGATGSIYGVRLFDVLIDKQFQLHVILSPPGEKVLEMEYGLSQDYFLEKGGIVYSADEIDAPIASGSFKNLGMVIAPCSMATLAAIANGVGTNLIHRAADVTLKEKRKLILLVRETPLNYIHIKNMLEASKAGAVIFPACPAFYNKPQSIDDLVNHLVSRILDQLDIDNNLTKRWEGN